MQLGNGLLGAGLVTYISPSRLSENVLTQSKRPLEYQYSFAPSELQHAMRMHQR